LDAWRPKASPLPHNAAFPPRWTHQLSRSRLWGQPAASCIWSLSFRHTLVEETRPYKPRRIFR